MTLETRAKIEWFKNADLAKWEFQNIYEFTKKEVANLQKVKNPSKNTSDDIEYYSEVAKVAQNRLKKLAEVA